MSELKHLSHYCHLTRFCLTFTANYAKIRHFGTNQEHSVHGLFSCDILATPPVEIRNTPSSGNIDPSSGN